ncbi:FAD-dependent monooxygenase [Nitrogeniibacter aestuarii]|uniref:FAD-dependent monooxygenase n=1 Tax=Nitrogeniibacter aestuarii TaxID=2815343 RepID=UPI001E4ADA25|nr:FAD-dependent monooxygenase [Nitrogeniibacter aestuarii]
MNTPNTDTDVLIVGAGPVGLFMANECARRGLRWRIVEARRGLSEHSKALAIFPRTLEVFDMAGIAEPFVESANRVTSVRVMTHGRSLAHLPFRPEDSPYPFIAMVPQNLTEAHLADALTSRGGHIDFDTRFEHATQGTGMGMVHVQLKRHGEPEFVSTTYLVACDGAHSTVRKDLGLPFRGGEYAEQFMLADIETDAPCPHDELLVCPHEDGPLAIFPMSATHHRVVASVKQVDDEVPHLALVQRLLNERAPGGIRAAGLIWSSYFHIHHRRVPHLRQGNTFLAGDAAHIHSPFGGQGMNTGLQDAWNLVWKLDLTLKGHGTRALIDSYDEERTPVIRHVVGITDVLTRAMASTNPVVRGLRDRMIPLAAGRPGVQHAVVQQLSELGIDYHGSPIVTGDAPRYLDDSLRGGQGIVSRYLLLMGKDLSASLQLAARHMALAFKDVLEVRFGSQHGIALVRPDGYLAYQGHRGEGMSALEKIFSLLERQAH